MRRDLSLFFRILWTVLLSGPFVVNFSARAEVVKVQYALTAEPQTLIRKTADVVGIVGYVSGLETNSFMLFDSEHLRQQGLHVRVPTVDLMPGLGDVVKVSGSFIFSPRERIFEAESVEIASSSRLPEAKHVKQADFRRGLLEGRRIRLDGRVRYVLPDVDSTVFRLTLDDHDACVRVPGVVTPNDYLDRRVTVTGIAINRLGSDGELIEAELHVGDLEDVVVENVQEIPTLVFDLMIALGVWALLAITILTALWRNSVRRRREAAVIAAERRRMAADLHDTIEQYLAGAKLIATGVKDMKDVDPRVASAMGTLGELLASAKKEVRAVVMDLRSEANLSIEDFFQGIVDGLTRTGVKARVRIIDPKPVSQAAAGDLAMIVREAVTNAVKHGKAKHIGLLVEHNTVRVSNDGEPFDVTTALGPETGHFGVSGMRERAAKNGFSIEWTRHGRWNETKVTL